MKTKEIIIKAIEFENGDQLLASQYNKNFVLVKESGVPSGKIIMEYTDNEMSEIYKFYKI